MVPSPAHDRPRAAVVPFGTTAIAAAAAAALKALPGLTVARAQDDDV
jgi:hypothetical protein